MSRAVCVLAAGLALWVWAGGRVARGQTSTSRRQEPPLFAAVHSQQPGRVRQLLAAGADPNVGGPGGGTPLHSAAGLGNIEIVTLLLDGGARINSRSSDGFRPLYTAMVFGKLDVARLLIARGADVKARGPYGRWAIHFAAATRDVGLLRSLVGRGVGANTRDDDGYTPLHIAAGAGNAPMVKALLGLGADAAAKTKHGRTPLDLTRATAKRLTAERRPGRQRDEAAYGEVVRVLAARRRNQRGGPNRPAEGRSRVFGGRASAGAGR